MTDKKTQVLEVLVSRFEHETMFSSGFEGSHPYYKTIVSWGRREPQFVIPWLLHHISKRESSLHHWEYALYEIVGKENAPQIPEEDAGHLDRIAELWLVWGKAHGYLTS